jgi:Zn-dependent peptidase ImmA (M78 family)
VKEIRELTCRLVKQYGVTSPFELCDSLAVHVFRCELPSQMNGVSFQTEENISVILLNRELGKMESRYCCAHELGHVMLHPGLNALSVAEHTFLSVPRFEHEADFFAACLLIEPHLAEWNERYETLTVKEISCLSGLPLKVAQLWVEDR